MKVGLVSLMLCVAALAWGQTPGAIPRRVPDSPSTQPAFEFEPAPGDDVPVTPPTRVRPAASQPVTPAHVTGTPVRDVVATIQRQANSWNTITDERMGRLYLLPSSLLETVEKEMADNPQVKFRLSGEIYPYRGLNYLMLRRALVIQPEQPEASPTPMIPPPPAPSITDTAPATSNPSGRPSPEEIARLLLKERPGTPVVPDIAPYTRTAPPAVSTAMPLKAGPGNLVVDRLARLTRTADAWFVLSFESDNTLQEPPIRVLPNDQLEKLERLSKENAGVGAVYHVSGEIHNYLGNEYILIRTVVPKRNMNQF